MRIKTKLTLGVGLLFIMIALLAILGAAYNIVLSDDTQNILADNYNTLEYSRNILTAMDDKKDRGREDAIKYFEENLIKQQHNITEIGEQELTDRITTNYEKYKTNPNDSVIRSSLHQDLYAVMKLNMDAIQRKSKVAIQTSKTANLWITLTGTFCFLFAFSLLVNFPGNIANPIKELTESIRQIANKNYSERLHFESGDEFGDLASSFNTMGDKLQEYESSNLSKMLFDKKRIETLINNMHDPVIGVDENIKILFVNDEALKILGLKLEELIGKYAKDVSIFNDLIRSLTKDLVIEHTEKQNISSSQNTIKIFADNKESYFEKEIIKITITPTGENEKKDIGHVIILKNITPFKELDFAKTNFIATVSHELKTPISSIKMSLHLLENKDTGNVNNEQKQLINSIKEDSERLLKITGELLNLSQVETGNIQLNIQQSDPYEILKYATDAIKVSADQKQIELIVDADEKLPNVKADTEKTAWVLINFLTNAIRYSPDHSKIKIIAKLLSESEGNGKQKTAAVLFSVKDQGIGIDSRYRERIFDRYFQVPGSNRTGTGLGLTISKEFIEAQGGHIGVESEVGMGSTFFFRLIAS